MALTKILSTLAFGDCRTKVLYQKTVVLASRLAKESGDESPHTNTPGSFRNV
jgi:hypothetical protein